MHAEYDVWLVLLSIAVAIGVSFAAFSVENLSYYKKNTHLAVPINIATGMIFGLAIWAMHFIGMLACHMPHGYRFDVTYTTLSYVIAAFISMFALWLNTLSSLPVSRVILGAVFMGLGISAMHYTGMAGVIFEHHAMIYQPMIVLLSIAIAILGSGVTFYLSHRFKSTSSYHISPRFFLAVMMGLSIAAMHYTGMASVYFVSVDQVEQYELFQSNHAYFVLGMLFLLVLVIIVGASFSLFEKQIALKKQDVDRLNVEIVNLNTHDQLTQLPNRLFVENRIGEILQQHRADNQQLAFLYIDLDRFRMINEIYGHKMADQLFIEVVKRVKQTLWRNVRLARFGSDELVMMVSNATGEEAKALAKQVNAKIKRNYRIGDQTIALSASIGVAMFPEHGNSFKELVMNADLAMLQAKARGGNGFYYFDENLEAQRVRQEYNLINDLTTAIIHDQLVLHYQPKYNANLQCCGVEALIRWQHPKLGLLTPYQFIDLAEKSGLIVSIGHWVLEQACKQIQLWQTSDFPLVPIAINFSASQFEHDELFEVLDELLEKYQIDAKYLIIEVTETTAMRNVKLCVQKFERLRQIGLQIAIDDFGTGYSSFSYLKDLPIDELKIDKVFVSHLDGENKKDEIILASIINLASQLGLIVTAEGVETEQQAKILIRLGCHQLQGYYFAKPMPIEDLAHSKFDLQKV